MLTKRRFIGTVAAACALPALMVTHDVGEAIALADRVALIEDGRVTLDLPIDMPRPRHRGTAEFARLEGELLQRLLQRAE